MRWRKSKARILGFIVLLPSFLLLGIFVYYFIGRTVWWSLTDWGQNPEQALAANPVLKFVGLANYRQLFTGIVDGRFRQDLVSTIFFTVFFIAGCLALGLPSPCSSTTSRRVKASSARCSSSRSPCRSS